MEEMKIPTGLRKRSISSKLLIGSLCLACMTESPLFPQEGKLTASSRRVLTIEYSHRDLSVEEATTMVRSLLSALDKGLNDVQRLTHIYALTGLVHASSLPALHAMFCDQGNSSYLRVRAILAIAHVPDEETYNMLVDAINDKEEMVRVEANMQLQFLTEFLPYGTHMIRLVPKDEKKRKALIDTWKTWRRNNPTKPLQWQEVSWNF